MISLSFCGNSFVFVNLQICFCEALSVLPIELINDTLKQLICLLTISSDLVGDICSHSSRWFPSEQFSVLEVVIKWGTER